MTVKKQKSAALLCYLCAIFFAVLVGKEFFTPRGTQLMKMLSAVLFFTFSFCGTALLCRTTANKSTQRKIVRVAVLVMSVVYFFFLVWFTLTDDSFGRHIHSFTSADRVSFSEYAQGYLNLAPFATVRLFVNGYQSGTVSMFSIVVNLLGNLLVLTPTAFFLPTIFPCMRRFRCFFFTVSALVLGIEILQFLLQTGSADVDDYLLNVLGACVAFFLLKYKLFSKKKGEKTRD